MSLSRCGRGNHTCINLSTLVAKHDMPTVQEFEVMGLLCMCIKGIMYSIHHVRLFVDSVFFLYYRAKECSTRKNSLPDLQYNSELDSTHDIL